MYTITHHWDGTLLPVAEQPVFSIAVQDEHVVVRVQAVLPWGVHAPEVPAGFTDGLWEYDVVELFAVAPDGTYLEIELGPKGHWLAYWFSGYRNRMDRSIDHAALAYTAQLTDEGWTGTCTFPVSWLPASWSDCRWNMYQIRRRGDAGEYDYLAWKGDATIEPDFHQTTLFASLLGAQ